MNQEIARSRDEKEKKLRLLIDNLNSVVYRYLNDKNQTIEFISEGCFDLFGNDPQDFLNTPGLLSSLIHQKDLADHLDRIQKAVMKKQGYQTEFRIIIPSGIEKWVWGQCECVISENVDVIGFEGLLVDVTDNKRSITALTESEQIKSEFIMTASHELRMPLYIMQLRISSLLKNYSGQISDEVKDDLLIIQNGIDRLMNIVKWFLLLITQIKPDKFCLKFIRLTTPINDLI